MKTHRWAIALGSVAMVLAVSQLALAQRGFRGFGGLSSTRLVSLEQVQTELKLNNETKAKADEISEKLRNQQRELLQDAANRESFRELRPKLDELSQEAEKKIKQLLDEPQQKRLREITLQVQGTSALYDASVAAELNVNDQQQEKLTEVRRAASEAMRDAFQNLGDATREQRREKVTQLQAEADKKLLAVLTDEQRKQFEKIKGAKFELDLSQLRRGGRNRDRDGDNN